MTRPGPLGRRRAPSSSSTSSSSTMASGGIRRSGISAPGPSSDGWITKHQQLNPGVYEIGASPQHGDRAEGVLGGGHRRRPVPVARDVEAGAERPLSDRVGGGTPPPPSAVGPARAR